jgi:hypothetical protein
MAGAHKEVICLAREEAARAGLFIAAPESGLRGMLISPEERGARFDERRAAIAFEDGKRRCPS